MTCRHNIEHVGCPSCREWRQQRDRKVAEQQHARFSTGDEVMHTYLKRRYPVWPAA